MELIKMNHLEAFVGSPIDENDFSREDLRLNENVLKPFGTSLPLTFR